MSKQAPDRLIDAVVEILRQLNRPASAREIVDYARNNQRYKTFFETKTPQKTLNARIAIDILRYGSESRFYRYAPAAYGLREALHEHSYNHNYKRIFFGNSRRKEVSNEPVATIKTKDLKLFDADGLYPSGIYPLRIMEFLNVRYVDRRYAETRDDLKQIVSYAFLYHDDKILAFEKGRYTSDDGEFIGKQSIGFGGHVNYYDLSLFSDVPVGLYANILRELYEELYFAKSYLKDAIEKIEFVGYLLDSSTLNGRKHIGLAASVKLKYCLELETVALGFRNLRWISANKTPNSFSKFEIWSQYLYRHLQRSTDSPY